MVRDVFRERLSLISTADKGLIFYLLDDLILLHSDLLEGLTTTKNKDIGKVFLLHMSRITYLVKLTTCFNEFSGYESTNFFFINYHEIFALIFSKAQNLEKNCLF